MSEDRLQILKMIENGTISADDGLKLLDAVSGKTEETISSKSNPKSVKWVRVVVTDEMKSKTVDIKLPSSLFKIFGTKIIKGLDTDTDIDMDEILELIRSGVEGELVNITTDDGHLVVISLV